MGKRLPRTLSESDVLRLVKGVKDKRYKLAYFISFYQTLRISELVGLKEEVSACCRVPISSIVKQGRKTRTCSKCGAFVGVKDIRRGKKWKIEPLKPSQFDLDRGFLRLYGKGGKEFDVPIMEPVRKALRGGMKLLPLDISPRQLQRQIRAHSEEILGKDKSINFHSLRHSGATFYLNNKNLDIRFVQQLLRHSRLDTTQIYTHVSPSQLKDKFDALWD